MVPASYLILEDILRLFSRDKAQENDELEAEELTT